MGNFLMLFFSILSNFIANRLILQTDLIMVSSFGSIAIAAFAIPINYMFFDQIVALSLTPILGAKIATSVREGTLSETIKSFFILTLFISIICTIVSFLLYPLLIKLTVPDVAIRDLGIRITLVLSISIVMRFIQTFSSTTLHAIGKSRYVVIFSLLGIAINAVLNYLLMFSFKLGISGCYWSTVITSFLVASTYVYFYHEYLKGIFSHFYFGAIRNLKIFKDFFYEMLRVSSEKIAAVVVVSFIALIPNYETTMKIFSIGSSLQSLLWVILIVNMRALSIYLSKMYQDERDAKAFLFVIIKRISLLALMIAIILLTGSEIIIKYLYNVHDQISLTEWQSFSVFLAITFFIDSIDSNIRGFLIYKKDFKFLSIIDNITNWGIFVLFFAIGAILGNTRICWLSYLLSSLSSLVAILWNRRNIWKPNHHA